jgi:hypothetical protein
MSLVRKTLAKYGAKIPAVRSTGVKQAQQGKQGKQGKQGVSVDAFAEAGRDAKKSDDKKR